LLTEAGQLEPMIMLQYHYAKFSLKNGEEEGPSGEPAEAIAGGAS
jgi:hypothetical protein